jgi:hypothetical protein
MTDDLGRELRERLGRAILPAAPSSLRDEIESLRAMGTPAPVPRRSARPPLLLVAAALVTIGLVAAGVGGGLLPERNEALQDLSLLPSPSPSNSPSPSAALLTWSQASLEEDWPAPVRAEPAGGASVQPMPLTHLDPTGDTGSDVLPWVDIRAVTADTGSVHVRLVSNRPPVVDPAEQWIAYGVVTDEDRDGVADWRYGIDNVPVDAAGENRPRAWRTNVHTGQTDQMGFLDTGWTGAYPDGVVKELDFRFGGTRETAGGGSHEWGIELDMPFYTWASVIVNGRLVATDYAPDAGWLVATPGAKPGGTYLLEGVFGLGDPVQEFPLHLSMTVPAGWTNYGGPELTRDSEGTVVQFLIVDNPEDPCFGPSFDDFLTYVADLPLIDISENTDVTIDGYRGKHIEYMLVEGDVECGALPFSVGRYNDVWILDIDGVRLVIDAQWWQAPAETVRSEVRQIVESIQIER